MNGNRFPIALTSLRQWVNYHPDTKKPHPKITGNLLTFEQAARTPFVGFVFTAKDGFVGIDIDKITPTTKSVLEGAREVGAYIEQSMSGVGWHVIGKGELSHALVDHARGVEVYADGRFFIMTGTKASGDPEVSIQAILDLLTYPRPHVEEAVAGSGGEWSREYVPALAAIPSDDYDTWLRVGMAMKACGADIALWDQWASSSPKYQGMAESQAKWRSFKRDSGVGLGTILYLAQEHGFEIGADYDPDAFDEPPDNVGNPWSDWVLDAAALARTDPPVREWCWHEWIPFGCVSGLSGPPGVAKSTLGLQLCAHIVLGEPLLGAEVVQAPACFITVEDDDAELHVRLVRVLDGLDEGRFHVESLQDLGLIPANGMDTALVDVDPKTKAIRLRERFHELRRFVAEGGYRLVVLDLANDFWTGEEIVRREVTSYVRGTLARWAMEEDIAVLLLMHTNKLGEVSGSTAWLGSMRSALVLSRDGEDLLLDRPKANYAPVTREPVRLRWDRGYLRLKTEEEVAREAETEAVEWLRLLPADVWLGVDQLRERWPDTTRAEARRRAGILNESGTLEARDRDGRQQWKR